MLRSVGLPVGLDRGAGAKGVSGHAVQGTVDAAAQGAAAGEQRARTREHAGALIGTSGTLVTTMLLPALEPDGDQGPVRRLEQPVGVPKLKGLIGERSNHSNHSKICKFFAIFC